MVDGGKKAQNIRSIPVEVKFGCGLLFNTEVYRIIEEYLLLDA